MCHLVVFVLSKLNVSWADLYVAGVLNMDPIHICADWRNCAASK